MIMKLFHRISTAAVLGASMLSLAIAPANAAACRDAHGRFAKCPTTAAAAVRPAHATSARAAKVASAATKHEKATSATTAAIPATKMAGMASTAKAPHAAKKAGAAHAG
jgi:hypothetical protein